MRCPIGRLKYFLLRRKKIVIHHVPPGTARHSMAKLLDSLPVAPPAWNQPTTISERPLLTLGAEWRTRHCTAIDDEVAGDIKPVFQTGTAHYVLPRQRHPHRHNSHAEQRSL